LPRISLRSGCSVAVERSVSRASSGQAPGRRRPAAARGGAPVRGAVGAPSCGRWPSFLWLSIWPLGHLAGWRSAARWERAGRWRWRCSGRSVRSGQQVIELDRGVLGGVGGTGEENNWNMPGTSGNAVAPNCITIPSVIAHRCINVAPRCRLHHPSLTLHRWPKPAFSSNRCAPVHSVFTSHRSPRAWNMAPWNTPGTNLEHAGGPWCAVVSAVQPDLKAGSLGSVPLRSTTAAWWRTWPYMLRIA
jgi:hypothetical protein